MFVQPDPRQFPQAEEHSMLWFLHVHRRVLQSAMKLHMITRSKFSGAGARSVCSGTNPMSHCCQLHSVGRSPPADPFPSWTCRCTRRVWYITAPEVMAALMDEHETCSMLPSHRTANAEGSPGCQSSYHCIVPPMLSLLHMPHRAWKLNAYAVL